MRYLGESEGRAQIGVSGADRVLSGLHMMLGVDRIEADTYQEIYARVMRIKADLLRGLGDDKSAAVCDRLADGALWTYPGA